MKQNHWRKRITACILLAAMTVLSVSGCGNKTQDESKTNQETTSQTETSGANANQEPVAKGRYVEHKIELPVDEDSMWILDIVKSPEGNFQLFAKDKNAGGPVQLYEYNGSVWTLITPDYLSKIPQNIYISHIAYSSDGIVYLTYRDAEYKEKLAKVSDTADFTVIPLEEISKDMITNLHVSKSGILLSLMWNTMVLEDDGTVLRRLPHKSAQSDNCFSFAVTEDSFLAPGDQGFIRYNEVTGEEKEIIPYQSGEEDIYGSLAAAGEGEDFYLCNSAGIHRMMENGTIWETIVDGSLTSLGMPSINIKKMMTGSDNDYYVWCIENEKSNLIHFTYDADMPSVPSKTLTIYGLNLSDNKTLRQAASLFQMANPDVKIEIIDGHSDAGGISVSDTIRSLNTELVNGKGADILVLDGLPARSYKEKGILEDMQKIIGEMIESGELYDNVADKFYEEDGAVYQIPTRISFPVIIGNEEDLRHFSTLEDIAQYQNANPDKPITSKARYENILREYANLYYTELVNPETGQLVPGKVKTLLETVKTLGDACGAKVIFGESENDGRLNAFGFDQGNRIKMSGIYDLYGGSRLISIEMLNSINDMMLPYSAIDKRGYSMEQLNGSYLALGMLGVTSTGKEKETAMEFVRFVLGSQVQSSDLRDGFPVNPEAVDQWQEKTSEYSVAISVSGSDDYLDGYWPEPERRQELLGYLNTLNNPIILDGVLMEMIINESKGYFEGTQTAAQAAAAVENKAKLYEAEQQ